MYRLVVEVSNPGRLRALRHALPMVSAAYRRFQCFAFTLEFDEMRQQRELRPLMHHRVDIVIDIDD